MVFDKVKEIIVDQLDVEADKVTAGAFRTIWAQILLTWLIL